MYSEKIKVDNLNEAIIETIAFFDLFSYPLTLFEIWQWAQWPRAGVELSQVVKALNQDTKKLIEHKNGYYFLAERERIIRTRLNRYNFTNQKFKRVHRVIKLFKIIPWIKLVAVSNIIGSHNLKEESDIDLFVVTSKNRLWLTRFASAGLMALLNLRPRPGKEQDKICLNFYVSEDNLDLKSLHLPTDDIYFIYWLAGLMPVYNRDNTYEDLIKSNAWLNVNLPNWQTKKITSSTNETKTNHSLWYEAVDLFFGGIEKNVKELQIKKFPQSIKENINKDTKIVISNKVIKLHVKDRREEYYKMWQERVRRLENKGLSHQEILNIASV